MRYIGQFRGQLVIFAVAVALIIGACERPDDAPPTQPPEDPVAPGTTEE